ncbi:hypothetical protein FRUB_06972 [Fimbriiglobus ruber]|uniref:Uncharacterized protein n=1 Tax=Fimbriiglobus ruber TaxID=1908690 RepID=A0A225D8S0_9BACT|nr:hypothetical protein FRUB_06972 [Fimbriiglobus ruber]
MSLPLVFRPAARPNLLLRSRGTTVRVEVVAVFHTARDPSIWRQRK